MISGVRHPASTTTVTILVPPLVGVEESGAEEEEEEEEAAAERRFAFRAGLPASRDDVELIPREGGTDRRLALLLLLLLQATRAEAAAAEAREKTREAGRPAVFRGTGQREEEEVEVERRETFLNLFCLFIFPLLDAFPTLYFPLLLFSLTCDGCN